LEGFADVGAKVGERQKNKFNANCSMTHEMKGCQICLGKKIYQSAVKYVELA
jgi:hypothetical protein